MSWLDTRSLGRVPTRKSRIDPCTDRVPDLSVSIEDFLIGAWGEVWIGEPMVDCFFRGRHDRADGVGIV